MKRLITAIALTIAAPALAQTAPAPAPEKMGCCCEKMSGEKANMACCEKMKTDKSQGAGDPHAGHQR